MKAGFRQWGMFLVVAFFSMLLLNLSALGTEEGPDMDKANTAFFNGDFAQAKEEFLALERLIPRDAGILQKIAALYLLENDTAQAQAYYEKAIQNTPAIKRPWPLSVELYMDAAIAYFRDDNFARAAEYLGKAAGPFGMSFIEDLKAAQNQLEMFHGLTPYVISGDESVQLPFLQLDPLPIVQLSINGSAPLDFIIDTGAEEIFIDDDIARELGIVTVSESAIPKGAAAGSGAAMGLGKIDVVQIGGIRVENIPANISDLGVISEKVFQGRPINGIIGTRFLMHFLSSIDYRNQRLILRQKTPDNRMKFESELQGTSPKRIGFSLFYTHLILARGAFNGENEGLYMVDTGLANAGLLSSEQKMRNSGVVIDWSKSTIGAGIGGEAEALKVTVDEVSLGTGANRITRSDVPGVILKEGLNIVEDGQMGFQVQGLISHEFFKGSILTFDFENMELVIQE